IPETCRDNLSERTAGLASPACWPRRAVGAPYLKQSSYVALLRFRGSLFYFSLAEISGRNYQRATISVQLSPMMKHNTHSTSAGISSNFIAGVLSSSMARGFDEVPLLRFNYYYFFFVSQSFSVNWKIIELAPSLCLNHRCIAFFYV
ncbi:hypothetical protein ALC56_13580, partial [Trachymyrmex septentrionalis]